MARKRKYYNIERQRFDNTWACTLPECRFVSREYARGYLNCMDGFYPSTAMRVVDTETGNIILEKKENGKLNTNYGRFQPSQPNAINLYEYAQNFQKSLDNYSNFRAKIINTRQENGQIILTLSVPIDEFFDETNPKS